MSEERDDVAGQPDDDVELNDDFDEPEGEELEADDEADEQQPQDEPEEPRERAPRTRSPGRRERQAAALREQREQVSRLERELQQLRLQQSQPRIDPYEQQRRDQAEREQVAFMPLEQQSIYWNNRVRQDVSAALIQQRAEITDQIERSSWEQSCRADPMRRRYMDRVEQTLNQYPPGQQRPPREVVFRYLVGEEVERRRTVDGGRQRNAAARRVRSQTTQPGPSTGSGVRSDQPRERTQGANGADNSLEALRRRVYGSNRPLW